MSAPARRPPATNPHGPRHDGQHEHHDPDQPQSHVQGQGHDPSGASSVPTPALGSTTQVPVLGWGWVCFALLLLAGQAVLLVIATWTLAVATQNHWRITIALDLAVLVRLVGDALVLCEWACTATAWLPTFPSWLPPLDAPDPFADWAWPVGTALAALVLAALSAMALQPPTP